MFSAMREMSFIDDRNLAGPVFLSNIDSHRSSRVLFVAAWPITKRTVNREKNFIERVSLVNESPHRQQMFANFQCKCALHLRTAVFAVNTNFVQLAPLASKLAKK